jgi:hypothetical protein
MFSNIHHSWKCVGWSQRTRSADPQKDEGSQHIWQYLTPDWVQKLYIYKFCLVDYVDLFKYHMTLLIEKIDIHIDQSSLFETTQWFLAKHPYIIPCS